MNDDISKNTSNIKKDKTKSSDVKYKYLVEIVGTCILLRTVTVRTL